MDELFLVLKAQNEKAKFGDILDKILYKQDINLKDFNVSYANSFSTLIFDYRDEIVDYILENGFTNFLTVEALNESIVAAGTPQNRIVQLLQKYLDKVQIDNELIILDPFFYAPTNITNYPAMIESILVKYIPTIDHIKIITTDRAVKIDSALKNQIEFTLKAHKPSLQISHTMTPDYHDRFWISSNREKGIVSGTSLNGLGNRLALIDRLNTSDVRDIVTSLKNDGLI